jgi:NADPH-dependent glutamate synthase beta subunit-like oxidoreductase
MRAARPCFYLAQTNGSFIGLRRTGRFVAGDADGVRVDQPEVDSFDERRGTIPNVAGRVVDGEHHVTGEYVTGWIRRGPSGVIGTNKKDATETVELLLEDAAAGRLEPKPDATAAAVDSLLAERGWRQRAEAPCGRLFYWELA